MASTRYNAFVSYSHSSDGAFASGFQQRLEAFARPARVTRAVRVFRDEANLAANPDLWQGIERALASSEWLILLASPHAATSPWVGKEIQWWLRNRSAERILIGLTSGHLAWDAAAGDFDEDRNIRSEGFYEWLDLSCFQETGPGRSTRCARAREFQDQGPILMLHEENPFSVKLRISGPIFLRLRNIKPIAGTPFGSILHHKEGARSHHPANRATLSTVDYTAGAACIPCRPGRARLTALAA